MPNNIKGDKNSFMNNAEKVTFPSKADKHKSSVFEIGNDDTGAAKVPPPSVGTCGTLVSPYDAAVVRNWDAKLYSNKVFNIWYKRYANLTPQTTAFQPYDEVKRRDDDIALQYYLGPSYRLLTNPEDPWDIKQKDAFIRRYSKVKNLEEDKRTGRGTAEPEELMRVLSLRSILATKKAKDQAMKDMFGPSGQDKLKTEKVCKVFVHLRNKRKRKSIAEKRLKENSKWHFLKSEKIRKRLHSIYKIRIASEARMKFVKIIHTVFHIRNFIYVVSKLAGDTHSIFSGLKHLKAERERLLDKSKQTDSSRLKKFNPAQYTFNKEVHLSPEIKLTLTKPWTQRTMEEVEKIVESLQQIRTFVAYPIAYQRVLAKAAWYIVVPAFRVVIRQRHDAVSYYFMISGRANQQTLLGSPHHMKVSEFKQIRALRAQDTFGEEAITNPGCVRDYTVTTETACELLSINCNELQDVMLVTSSLFETAPEHIRFLGSLNAMKKFPKLKLLEEAQDNINIAHFVNGSVVTTNVEKSPYVYFVFYGTCDVMKEIPPPQSVINKFDKEKMLAEINAMTEGTVSPIGRKSVLIKEAMRRDSVPLATETNTTRRSYFTDRREYIESRANLRSLFVKEIEKRQNEYNTYRNAFMAETRDLEAKCRNFTMTMPAAARRKFLGGQTASQRVPLSEYRPSFRGTRRRETIFKRDTSGNSSTEMDKGKAGGAVDTSKRVAKMEPVSESHEDGDDIKKQKHIHPGPARVSSRFTSRETSAEFLGLNDDREDNKLRSSKRFTKLVGSNMSLLDAVFRPSFQRDPGEGETQTDVHATVPDREEENSHDSLAKIHERVQTSNFSRWAVVRTAIRGDVVGTEFLDFRAGPFEPPKEIWSIVTTGATIIMVKKSFILKYLRKQW